MKGPTKIKLTNATLIGEKILIKNSHVALNTWQREASVKVNAQNFNSTKIKFKRRTLMVSMKKYCSEQIRTRGNFGIEVL